MPELGKYGLDLEKMVEMFFTLHIYILCTYANSLYFVKLCKGKCPYEDISPVLLGNALQKLPLHKFFCRARLTRIESQS